MLLSSTTSERLIISIGLFTCISGVLGGVLNVIVFLSFHTFHESSCAFYLTMISFLNLGQLMSGYFPRILISGFQIDWTQSSIFYCKFRWFHVQSCLLIISTCLCLATIDQFSTTCVNPRWHQYANIKIARRLCLIFTCIWLLHGIPYLIYQSHVVIPHTNRTICAITNRIFRGYFAYGNVLVLNGFLPVMITVVFGCLAYRNLWQLAFSNLADCSSRIDKQLTTMVLMQVILNCVTTVPYLIIVVLLTPSDSITKLVTTSAQAPALTTAICLYYFNFSCPFYIYICVSERFRRQLKHILFDVCIVHWRQRIAVVNEVALQT